MSEDVDSVGPLKKQSEDITQEATDKEKEELLEKRKKKR
jgi:hypothetical protein